MVKNYIKMNSNNYLSLGNVINTIKKVSNNNNAMQTEIFCSIFDVNNVNPTTINNYCVGLRAIGLEYKDSFLENYNNDNLYDSVISLLNILDNKIYSVTDKIDLINTNQKLQKVISNLLSIASEDMHISDVKDLMGNNNYETFKNILYYAIIENKQPIYIQSNKVKINYEELEEYMKVKLYWGQSYISSLIELARKGNMYACAELGSQEYDGNISGKKDYEKCYKYYLTAANKDHPKACWMIANMILNKKIELSEEIMWKYLDKAISLGSAAAYNTLGLCYLKGAYRNKIIDVSKAIYNFTIASELGYSFAFNNLGKIYEHTNEEEAFKYYKISADMNNSWAMNKVGEYYRKKGDIKNAFLYYNGAINCPINERCYYAYYNLAKYFYVDGCPILNIKKNKKLANEYLNVAKSHINI